MDHGSTSLYRKSRGGSYERPLNPKPQLQGCLKALGVSGIAPKAGEKITATGALGTVGALIIRIGFWGGGGGS